MFNVQLPFRSDSPRGQGSPPSFRAKALDLLASDLSQKLAFAGLRTTSTTSSAFSTCKPIDNRWLDHLEGMEALREAVYLRSYAQKNPLVEYKLEGFDIFEKMIEDIRRSIATKRLFLVRIQTPEERQAKPVRRPCRWRPPTTRSGSSAGLQPRVRAAKPPTVAERIEARRAPPSCAPGAKVGRNDPCPCGSGKKYKHCHGR